MCIRDSASGDRLMADETVQVLVRELFPLATVVTPNLDEAALLLGRSIPGIEALDAAARAVFGLERRRIDRFPDQRGAKPAPSGATLLTAAR